MKGKQDIKLNSTLSLFQRNVGRVYTRPPELVTTVMAAVCCLLEEKTDWVTARQVLADQQFLNRLINFDKESVSEKVNVRL